MFMHQFELKMAAQSYGI